MTALQRAIDLFGTQAALAAALGVTSMSVSHWKTRGVPLEQCRAIEIVTDGAVTRHEFYPEMFDAPAPASSA